MGKFQKMYESVKINESNLSRLYQHMLEHDTGTITAFRSEEKDKKGNVIKTYSKSENMANNKELKAVLLRLGYNLTSVDGTYIENFGAEDKKDRKEVKENVFFVVDKDDSGKLKSHLEKLGNKYHQDSVMFIPKESKDGILVGTKKDKYSDADAYPSYKQEITYSKQSFGKEQEFMTKIRNRPFAFLENVVTEEYGPSTISGKYGMYGVALKVTKTIDEDIYNDVLKLNN